MEEAPDEILKRIEKIKYQLRRKEGKLEKFNKALRIKKSFPAEKCRDSDKQLEVSLLNKINHTDSSDATHQKNIKKEKNLTVISTSDHYISEKTPKQEFSHVHAKSPKDIKLQSNGTINNSLYENSPDQLQNVFPKISDNDLTTNIKAYSLISSTHSDEDVTNSCLSVSNGGHLIAIIIYKSWFSLWSLEPDSVSKSADFQHVLDKDVGLITIKESSVLLGSENHSNCEFVVVNGPVNGCFNVGFLSVLPDADPIIVSQNIGIYGCCDCKFNACFAKEWEIFIITGPCPNSECISRSPDSTLWIVSFDAIYSKKRNRWSLNLDPIAESTLPCTEVTSFAKIHRRSELKTLGDAPMVLVARENGFLFRLGDKILPKTFDAKTSDYESVKSGTLLFAAAVKNVLILIYQVDASLKFFVFEPTSSVGLINFQNIDLRNHVRSGTKVTSTKLQQNALYFLTSDNQILKLNLE